LAWVTCTKQSSPEFKFGDVQLKLHRVAKCKTKQAYFRQYFAHRTFFWFFAKSAPSIFRVFPLFRAERALTQSKRY
jgi:hypothetical protein